MSDLPQHSTTAEDYLLGEVMTGCLHRRGPRSGSTCCDALGTNLLFSPFVRRLVRASVKYMSRDEKRRAEVLRCRKLMIAIGLLPGLAFLAVLRSPKRS